MKLTLRQAISKDLDWLDSLHAENMKSLVERVYSWKPTLFRDNFRPQEYEVIESRRDCIGFIKIVYGKQDIYLGEIQIKKVYQNKGIGTQLIQLIIEASELSDRRLWLKVVKGNSAENLYSRLGFKVFEESETHKKMERKPI